MANYIDLLVDIYAETLDELRNLHLGLFLYAGNDAYIDEDVLWDFIIYEEFAREEQRAIVRNLVHYLGGLNYDIIRVTPEYTFLSEVRPDYFYFYRRGDDELMLIIDEYGEVKDPVCCFLNDISDFLHNMERNG